MLCKKIFHFVISILFFVSVRSFGPEENEIQQSENTYTRLAKLVMDFREEYHSSNMFIARSDPSSDLLVSRALTMLMKTLSEKNVSSIITRIADIPRTISYSTMNLGKNQGIRPVFVVIIRSMGDFKTFAHVTKSTNLNLYRTLVIFTKNLIYCNKPQGNPLHLVFDMKMWVVCQDQPIVREWYSLEPNKTETNDLFLWTEDVPGFRRLTNLTFYERRSSLKGKKLRVTVLKDEKMTIDQFGGFFGTLLKELKTLANFTLDLQPFEKASGSYDDKTGYYSGIMGKLNTGKTDIGVGDLTITKERLDICDFSKPMLLTKANFYIRKPSDYHLMWSMYYYAFGFKASYCLLLFLVISPILVAIIVYRYNRFSFAGNVYENYLNVWGIFCAKSPSDFPEQWSARIAYYSLYILSFMLYSAYSALLVSYLANFNPDLPFYSLDEFAAAKTHRITTIKNTSFIDTFKVSNDMTMRNLNSFLLDDKDLPSTLMAAVDQACDKNKNLVLYIDDIILNSKKVNLPCELIPFERGRFGSMALAFIKHSPYLGLINFHIQRLRNIGLLNTIRDQNVKPMELIPEDYKPVDLYSTMPAFGILYFGMVLSAVMMILENGFFYCFSKPPHNGNMTSFSIRCLKFNNGVIRRASSKLNKFITK